ncbi:DUF4260 family protein [Demequina capsici]|uniref:DUF4260 family protein n=1 Tax=Demequina capsici TaxID=3075620 RepID=A0AA96F9G2_9MICO|nr:MULTISPECIES: DUF4260 family protein [unclassified Demequina]WNM23331.1 DUF4260 family protein [Demequina sp. OYTSA14]WNM26208.1 DUF4260 family protein [Demequina sp. PMTSA13]
MTPELWQRAEGAVIALVALAGALALGGWWWPLVLFLVYDLSALGYVAGTRVGAFVYNLVHAYALPSLLLLWGVTVHGWDASSWSRWLLLIAVSWFFHVGVDRALGYGLKHDDSFQHTHLGWIGRGRPEG